MLVSRSSRGNASLCRLQCNGTGFDLLAGDGLRIRTSSTPTLTSISPSPRCLNCKCAQ